MKRELLLLKKVTVEGVDSSNRLYDVDLILRESECFCLVSAVVVFLMSIVLIRTS